MKPCLKLILSLPETDQEVFATQVERAMRMGATQREAQISAAQALLDEVEVEEAAVMAALKEQHPDLLEARRPEGLGISPDFVTDNSEDSEYPGSMYAEFDGGMAYVKFFADAQGGLRVTTLSTEDSEAIRGRQVLKWLRDTYRMPIRVNEVDPPAAGFWDKMQSEGLIKDWSHRMYRGKTVSLPATAKRPAVPVDPDNPGIRYSIESGYSSEPDPDVLHWLAAQGKDPGEVGVVYDKPIEALRMAAEARGIKGFSKFTGISRIAAKHAMRDHPEMTPQVMASALAAMQSPRLIVDGGKKEDGRHAMVLVTPVNVGPGAGLPVLVAINSGKAGSEMASVALVATSYGKDNSAAWVAAQIKAGKVVYADEKELGRLARYQRALKLPSIQRASLPGGKVDQVPFSVLTTDNLGKFVSGQKGWNKGVIVQPEGPPADIGLGAKFSRSPGFELPEFGSVAKTQQAVQDRYNRWKQAVDAVRKQGGQVTEANDFYREEERYWGRVGAQNEAFGREIQDFVEAVQADGLTLQDVAEYAYARHAPERNAYVDSMRDDMDGAGSGMSNDEADSIMISAQQSGLEPLLRKHADTLADWIDGTRDVLEQNGLISDSERQAWEAMFTNYVPLRGLEGKEPGKGTGSGFDIRGRESKTLAGRRSQAKQIIEQIIQDRTRAYIRAGKNEVLRSFLNFALDNPSPNLWKINAVETKPAVVVDEFGNRLVEMRDTIVSDDRTVAVKDGGQTIYIEIKDKPLLEQMRNLHVEQVGKVVGALLWANRKVGAMLTAFNPVFVVMNGIRDAQAATAGMIDEIGFGGAARLLASYPRAFVEAYKAQFLDPGPEYRRYVNAGGTTGYFGLKDLNATGEDLQALMRNAERSAINPIKMAMAIATFVEKANSVVEQTARFAAYRAAIDSGKTVAQAASISKNITVNFNRKGTMSNALGAVVLFFNPAVQGTARIAQALKSPKVLATLASGSAGLVMLALMNAAIGGEDDDEVAFWDKVPKEVKDRNIVLMLPPERDERGKLKARYVKIPVAYGYNVFNVAANEVADQWRRASNPKAGRSPSESGVRLATAFISATMPAQALSQGIEDPSALVMLPFSNALGPIAQALANRSGFGRPLYPDYPNERTLPDSQKYSPSQAGTLFQKAAEQLNAATGGSAYESGLIDLAPGSIENAARFYGGGLASFSIDVMNAMYVRQHIERPEPDVKRLPFVKQLYGVIDDETDRWYAYDKMRKAEEAIQPFEQAKRDGDADAAMALYNEKGPIVGAGKTLTRIRSQLSDLRKYELSVINSKELTDGERYIKLMEISGKSRDLLQQWNKVYADLIEQRKE